MVHSYLRSTNRRRGYYDLNKSGCHVIDEAGDEPLGRQCGNRPERCHVDGNGCAGIGDRFCLEFRFLYLKIVRQHGGVAHKASDTTIGVLKHDDVKFTAASRNLPGNLTDSPE